MKTLTKLALAAVILTTTVAAQAEWVNGYVRNNGTYVQPYYRTPANGITCDNLGNQGYRIVPVPALSVPAPIATTTIIGNSMNIGGTTHFNYQNSNGGNLYGTTSRIGSTTFTTVSGQW